MATVLIRTIIIYVFFVLAIRLLGKRQVGELELSELIVTFMLSELATAPIQDPSIPLSYVLIPLVILIAFEIISSFLVMKSKKIKKAVIGNPSYLICNGKLNQNELARLRMSISELLGELRLKNVGDISSVDYAILEENGKLSVFQKNAQEAVAHALIVDGEINESNLKIANKSKEWLLEYLKSHNLSLKSIFLLTCDDNNIINFILKEEK